MKRYLTSGCFNSNYLRGIFNLLLIIVFVPACTKVTTVNLPSGKITIVSAKVTGLTSYEVEVNITLAEGQLFQNANLVFEDITVSGDSSFSLPLTPAPDGKNIIVTLKTNRLNHDYAVTAYMQTDKGKCISEKVIIRSSKNVFRVYLNEDPLHSDPEKKIAYYYRRGQNLVFLVDFTHHYDPKSIVVKLNDTIPVECKIEFGKSSDGISFFTVASCKPPTDFPAGVYDFHVYFDEIEFESESKFGVPEGFWIKYDTVFPGDKTIDRSWFVSGNNLFLVGGHFPNTTTIDFPVWKFNMETKVWQRKNNFPEIGDIVHDNILPFSLQYKGEGYVVYCHDTTLQIWKYQENNDSWTVVSTYPEKGSYRMISFILGDHLYLGGGLLPDSGSQHDFYSFDLLNNTWTKLNDTPILSLYNTNYCCVTENKAFIFECSRFFWEYDPESDKWIERKIFPGPRRSVTNLVASGNDIYVIGGECYKEPFLQLDDCWRYSIDSDDWELKAFLPKQSNYGLSFTWGEKIFAGLGYTLAPPWDIRQPEILQFIP